MSNVQVAEHEERPQLGTWENGIKMDLKGMECEAVDWIYASLDSVQWLDFMNTVMNLRVSLKKGNMLPTFCDY
jgi:hypothetical protein